jgi:hypothetical protein
LLALAMSIALWPYLIVARWMIALLLALEGRQYEYDADSIAVRIGYGLGLFKALTDLHVFERARSGWEDVLYATHPPREYRLEAIEDQLKKPQNAGQVQQPPTTRPAARPSKAEASEQLQRAPEASCNVTPFPPFPGPRRGDRQQRR